MTARVIPREYQPDLLEIMSHALHCASTQAQHFGGDAQLASLIMAGAIFDKVDAGVRDHEELVIAAVRALKVATRLSQNKVETLCPLTFHEARGATVEPNG